MTRSSLREWTLGVTSVAVLGAVLLSGVSADEPFSPHVDSDGNISFPADFRTTMVHLDYKKL